MTLTSLLSPRFRSSHDESRFFGACLLSGMLLATLCLLVVVSPSLAQTTSSASRANRNSGSELAPIADFINAKTLMVARFDLTQIDYDVLGDSYDTIFLQALRTLGLSEDSLEACEREFRQNVGTLTGELSTQVNKFHTTFGVSQIFFVHQTTRGDGSCFIIPLGDATAEQIQNLKDLAQKFQLNSGVYKKNYLIASTAPLKEIGDFYKDFKPAQNKDIENYFKSAGKNLFVFYGKHVKIRPLFLENFEEESTRSGSKSRLGRARNFDPFASSPRCVVNLIEIIDASLLEVSGYVDVSTLSAYYELKFSTTINSGNFQRELSDTIENFVNYYIVRMQEANEIHRKQALDSGVPDATVSNRFDELRVYQIVHEILVVGLQKLVPEQNEARLIYDSSVLKEFQKLGANTATISILARAVLSSSDSNAISVHGLNDLENPFKPKASEETKSPTPSANE